MFKMISLAKIISLVFEPKITILLFSIYIFIDRLINVVFIIIYSLVALLLLRKIEKKVLIDDYKFLDKNAQFLRSATYLFTIIFLSILLLFSFNNNDGYLILYFSIFLITSIMLFIISFFFKFKVSAHVVYSGYLFIFFLRLISFPLNIIILVVALLIIGLARYALKKHSIAQILIGIIIVIVSLLLINNGFIQ